MVDLFAVQSSHTSAHSLPLGRGQLPIPNQLRERLHTLQPFDDDRAPIAQSRALDPGRYGTGYRHAPGDEVMQQAELPEHAGSAIAQKKIAVRYEVPDKATS